MKCECKKSLIKLIRLCGKNNISYVCMIDISDWFVKLCVEVMNIYITYT